MPLTPEQQGRIFGILSVGCDRETAANCVGCTTAELQRAIQEDTAFAAEVRRTEASTELKHMHTINKAIDDTKNWRASVWWLEMHAPDRFKPRLAGEVTLAQLNEFIGVLSTIFCEEVQNEHDRQRVLGRIYTAIDELNELVRAGARLSTLFPPITDTLHPLLSLTDDSDDDTDLPYEDT